MKPPVGPTEPHDDDFRARSTEAALSEARRRYEASEERYRDLFNNMTEGFAVGEVILGVDGRPIDFRFLEVNDAFELQSGLKRDIIGRPMTGVLPHLEPYWIDTYGRVALSGEPARFENYNIDTGRHYEVFCFCPSRGRFAILFYDITERKRAEAALRESEAELQTLNRQLRAVNETLEQRVAERTADLELRTIQLRALTGQLARAEEQERRRVAKLLHDSLQQLLVGARFSVESLRRNNKGQASMRGLEDVEAALCECINSTRSLTSELSPTILYHGGLAAALKWLARWYLEKHGLTVAVETEAGVEVEQEETRIALFQSVRELLFNVVKHARTGTACVRLDRSAGDAVRIVVSDEGAGFDPSEVRAREGTGGAFGLFSLRERLGLLGGSLEVVSSLGKGSRFTITAPLDIPGGAGPGREEIPAEPLISAKMPEPRADSGNIRILIVDDHTIVREGLARALSDEPGMEVAGQAGNGQAAVELTRHLQPDVVLMDVSMPRMNGIEATRVITAEFHHVKVIGLSMYDDGSHAHDMLQAGAAAFLDKSDAVTKVIAAIRKCSLGAGTPHQHLARSPADGK